MQQLPVLTIRSIEPIGASLGVIRKTQGARSPRDLWSVAIAILVIKSSIVRGRIPL